MNFTEQEMREIAAQYLNTSSDRISLVTFIDRVQTDFNHAGLTKNYAAGNAIVFAKKVNVSASYGSVATGGLVSSMRLKGSFAGGCQLIPAMNANGKMIPSSMSQQFENMVFDSVVVESVSAADIQIFGFKAVKF